MSDLIDRQKAINVIERMRAYIGHNMERAVGAAFIEILDDVGKDIGRLPSAQLATDTNVGDKLGTNLAQLGTDCISRQTILDAIDEISREVDDGDGFDYAKWRQYFCELPSVTPKQRTGKWIKLDMHRGMADHKCTACGQECYVPTCMGEPLYAFCPNCGADMRGEQNE